MLKITLDTNCVINLLDYEAESPTSVDELSEIIRYALEGNVNITITTRVQADLENDKNDERRAEMLRKVALFPVIGTAGRVGTSKWGGGDKYTSKDDSTLIKEIADVVFPQLSKDEKRYKNKINDIDHLFGHLKNGRDVFVTDDGGMLNKSEVLESSFGIKVVSPGGMVELLNSQTNKNVLAKEYYEKLKEYREWLLALVEKDEISDDDEKQYEMYREWFLTKTVKIQDELANISFRNSSVPIGGQRVFDYGDIMRMQREKEQLQRLFDKSTAEEQIDELLSVPKDRYGYSRSNNRQPPKEAVRNKFKLHLDALLSLIGATE